MSIEEIATRKPKVDQGDSPTSRVEKTLKERLAEARDELVQLVNDPTVKIGEPSDVNGTRALITINVSGMKYKEVMDLRAKLQGWGSEHFKVGDKYLVVNRVI
ncbi:MAG: hypothetical protein HZA34_01940 [Candidatus Pacebacteria bacterium]|nr:hypothetical protein [Candidatus Paceibacterota bacterium]